MKFDILKLGDKFVARKGWFPWTYAYLDLREDYFWHEWKHAKSYSLGSEQQVLDAVDRYNKGKPKAPTERVYSYGTH